MTKRKSKRRCKRGKKKSSPNKGTCRRNPGAKKGKKSRRGRKMKMSV